MPEQSVIGDCSEILECLNLFGEPCEVELRRLRTLHEARVAAPRDEAVVVSLKSVLVIASHLGIINKRLKVCYGATDCSEFLASREVPRGVEQGSCAGFGEEEGAPSVATKIVIQGKGLERGEAAEV